MTRCGPISATNVVICNNLLYVRTRAKIISTVALSMDIRIAPYRTVIGAVFHGTSQENARIIEQEGFKTSRNKDLLLGDGVYFYEGSAREAANYARKVRKYESIGFFRPNWC